MTGNGALINLGIEFEDLTNRKALFNPLTTSERNECRKKIETNLKKLANFVENATNGDETIIISCGFEIHKNGSKVGRLNAPENLIARTNNIIETAFIRWKSVKGASRYELQHAEASTNTPQFWNYQIRSASNQMLTSLTNSKAYVFRVRAIGTEEICILERNRGCCYPVNGSCFYRKLR